eukprot:COSAG04_NODE_4039_length_2349_cov_1.601778_1_plen_510_part_10
MSSKKAAKAAKAAKRSAQLVDAAADGDVETMERVMSSGGTLDLDALVEVEGWKDSTGKALPDLRVTALYAAVTHGMEAAVRFLLDSGANPSVAASDGFTSLVTAAVTGNTPIMRLLVDKQADLDAVGLRGYTALCRAVASGREDAASLLLDRGANPSLACSDGTTPLMHAAEKASAPVIQLLIEAKAEVDAVHPGDDRETGMTGETGMTAFLYACRKGCVECMQLLADAGTDTAATCNAGGTALIFAAQSVVPDAVRLALAKGWGELEARSNNGLTAFLFACDKGSVECMQLLVDAGCDTAVACNAGGTALMHAAGSGVPAATQLAVENGWGELEARSKEGVTAFLFACWKGSAECMQLLADVGCNTAVTCNAGWTGLMLAAQSGVRAASQLAVEKGWGELEARDSEGFTAFLWACVFGCVECVTMLADAGCDTAATSSTGQTALMLAARSPVPDAVRLALAKGWGELEARDEAGMTAFLCACWKGSAECMQLLADAGTDTAATSSNGET